jgi:transposase-like protein
MKKHHRIAADVKADILRRVKEEGVSVAQAAKDHGISEGTIYGWMVKGATGAPSWAESSRLQKQNRELLELVGEITLKLSMTQKKGCAKEETKQRLPEHWAAGIF